VTLLTQQRRTLPQQRRMHGPVGRVTQAAVLGHGRVLPQKRPALLGMTGETRVVDGRSQQRVLATAAVRRMALRARHALVANRMRECHRALRALPLMTAEAHLRLLASIEHAIAARMYRVTARTRDLIERMRAAMPRGAGVARVAAETHGILILGRHGTLRTEGQNRRLALAAPYTLRVRSARTVARFTLHLGERATRVVATAVRRRKNRQCRRVGTGIVAPEACVGTAPRVTRCSVLSRRLREGSDAVRRKR